MTLIEVTSPIVLSGGKVFTADRRRPWADAVGFDRGGILAVGSDEDVTRETPGAVRVDTRGATVVPGFIDAHNHFLATGESLASIDVRFPEVASVEDLVRVVADAARRTPEGRPISAFGFDHAKYERTPTRWDLDGATSRHPVLVYHVSGHHVLVNSRMLEERRFPEGAGDPPGGEIVRDEQGRATGLLLDAAMSLALPVAVDVGNHGPNFHTEAPIDQLVDDVERAGRAFRAAGLTTVCDAQVTARELTAYRAALRAGRLPVRTVAMPLSHQLGAFESVGLTGPFGDERLRLGAMKLYADGSLIGGTAAFSEPYGTSGELTGSMYWSDAEFASIVARAHTAGWQLGVHVQGDRAMQMVLDALEAAIVAAPREHRHRLEHAGFPTREQIDRIAELGLVTVNQPSYLFDSGDEFIERLGDRAHRLIPLRDEVGAGIVVVLSSDSDVASYRPMDTLASAIARRTRGGSRIGSDQALSLEEALFAHTIDAAYALFAEDRLGSLEPGKAADVVVVDGDLTQMTPEELRSARIRTTFLGGSAVYEAARA